MPNVLINVFLEQIWSFSYVEGGMVTLYLGFLFISMLLVIYFLYNCVLFSKSRRF